LLAEKKLILEIDGDVHGFYQQGILDRNREKYLESLGFRVLRFTNEDVKNSLEGVFNRIVEHVHKD